jgi:transcriptional regulator with XRE-family HTH domain
MSAPGSQPQRARLARALRLLREHAGLTQAEAAQRLGWPQPRLSKIERNQQKITVQDVQAICVATGTSAERREELLSLADAALVGVERWGRPGYQADPTQAQEEARQEELAAGLIRVYQPAIVPGLLQTPAYTDRIMKAGGVSADIAAARLLKRLERQRILLDESRRFEFAIPEAALRDWPGSPEEQIEQVERIVAVTLTRPNVTVGLLPAGSRSPVWRTHGFVLLDERGEREPLVLLETLTRGFRFDADDEIAEYRKAFDDLLAASATGDDARTLLDRVAEDLRRHG